MNEVARMRVTESETKLGVYLVRKRAGQSLRWLYDARIGDVLEIGPGRGVLAQEAIMCGFRYTAVDCDARVLERLPAKAHKIQQIVPPLHVDAFYGGIVCEHVLEHMPNVETAALLVESLAASLCQRGRLILRFPDIEKIGFGFWTHAPDHTYVTSLRRVAALVENSGLKIVRAGYYVDCFTGLPAHVISWLAMAPWRFLEWLDGQRPWSLNRWYKLHLKCLQAYILAEKPARTS